MKFVGVDLAWKEKNPSGLAIIDEKGQLLDSRNMWTDEEIIAYIRQHGSDGAVVAIDASLAIPNEEGSRECERELTKDFGRYNAGTYPSNRNLHLKLFGRLRGEELVHALASDFQPGITPPQEIVIEQGMVKQLIEVYPHASMVQLFQLDEIIKYKKGRVTQRREEMGRYIGYLKKLSEMEPALIWKGAENLDLNLDELRGQRLKAFEDRLDGIFCAYVAFYWHYWGLKRCKVYGDGKTGFIIVPGYVNT